MDHMHMAADIDDSKKTHVTRNDQRSRYEGSIDGEVAGFADYVRRDGVIIFAHTEVAARFEGRGVASAIARASLDDVRAAGGLRVVPQCSFYADWIVKHPEYTDLTEVGRSEPMR